MHHAFRPIVGYIFSSIFSKKENVWKFKVSLNLTYGRLPTFIILVELDFQLRDVSRRRHYCGVAEEALGSILILLLARVNIASSKFSISKPHIMLRKIKTSKHNDQEILRVSATLFSFFFVLLCHFKKFWSQVWIFKMDSMHLIWKLK